MDEEITIINSNTRNEKIKNFIIKNNKKIITVILLLIFILFSYFGYKELVKKNRVKIADNYNMAVVKYESKNKDDSKELLLNLIEEKDSTYSPLALYFLIDNDLISQKEIVNELFDKVINETKLEKEIKNLIIFKKALFNSNFENENYLIKMLNPIINSESIWKSHALFLLGEFFLSKNEKEKSKEFFQQILLLNNSNPEIMIEAKKRLNRDLSE